MPEILSDFPKLYCPFIRQTFKIDQERFRRMRGRFGSSATTKRAARRQKTRINSISSQ
ncbi:MAG: hypothetical protein ACE5GG_01915 [Candidatus Omnitrophota bacterium]